MAQDWQAYLDAIPDDLLSVDEKFQAEAHILHTIANVEDRIRLFRGEHAMQAGRIKALLRVQVREQQRPALVGGHCVLAH